MAKTTTKKSDVPKFTSEKTATSRKPIARLVIAQTDVDNLGSVVGELVTKALDALPERPKTGKGVIKLY